MTISEKITAPINKAKSTDSQAEADALMSKAQQLMRENNLSYSDVENTGNEIEREYFDQRGWKKNLLIVLADTNNCTIMKSSKGYSIIGEKQIIQTVKFLFEFYCNCLATLSEKYYQNNAYGAKIAIKTSYCNGAVVGLNSRLKKETKMHIEAEPTLQGIIHVKKDAVNQWIAKEIGKVREGSINLGSGSNSDAYYQGREDAQTISTNNKQLA